MNEIDYALEYNQSKPHLALAKALKEDISKAWQNYSRAMAPAMLERAAVRFMVIQLSELNFTFYKENGRIADASKPVFCINQIARMLSDVVLAVGYKDPSYLVDLNVVALQTLRSIHDYERLIPAYLHGDIHDINRLVIQDANGVLTEYTVVDGRVCIPET